MPFQLILSDIVTMTVDAIVNAANTELKRGGGVCGAIYDAAGVDALETACEEIGFCAVGEAVITPGFQLDARYIIHTPGPVWKGGTAGEAEKLRQCYVSALDLAIQNGLESIAFPVISSGIYGFPKQEAIQIATDTIVTYLKDHDLLVYLVLYRQDSFEWTNSSRVKFAIDAYIETHYEESFGITFERSAYFNRSEHFDGSEQLEASVDGAPQDVTKPKSLISSDEMKHEFRLKRLLKQLDESFSQCLLRLIDERGLTDVQTYKRANVDRKLFSKIRSDQYYKPSKGTALAFCIALELSFEQTQDLLMRAGYSLSKCSKFDVIIRYFIENSIYDIHEINQILFMYDQPLLGNSTF